jgi:hypothetical protein
MTLLNTATICNMLDSSLDDWYASEPESVEPEQSVESIVRAQHYANFRVWNLEDQARRTDVEDSYVANIKRSIDKWNQRRNDLMEAVDEATLELVGETDTSTALLHSETPGIMLDRLSIISLKLRHMGLNAARKEDPEVAEECAGKVEILQDQRNDLRGCIEQLVADMKAGTRYFKTYRQLKQYNDPRLNPAVREAGKNCG